MPRYAKHKIAKLVGIDQVTKHHDPLSLPDLQPAFLWQAELDEKV